MYRFGGVLGGNYKKIYMKITIKYVTLFVNICHFDILFNMILDLKKDTGVITLFIHSFHLSPSTGRGDFSKCSNELFI